MIRPRAPARLSAYYLVEAIIGRSLAWRLGRWLYLGARRELFNDPKFNGEEALQSWVLSALQKRTPRQRALVFFDVGANRGSWTAALLSRLNSESAGDYIVYVFEPEPTLCHGLAIRFSKECEAGLLEIDDRALGAEKKQSVLSIIETNSGTNSLSVQPGGEAIRSQVTVQMTTVDEFLHEKQFSYVDLLKIDTEGNDLHVIFGARQALADKRIRILQFEYNWRWVNFGMFLRGVYELAETNDYCVGRLTPFGIEVYPNWHQELERFIETNFVLVHREFLLDLPHWISAFDVSNAPIVLRELSTPENRNLKVTDSS